MIWIFLAISIHSIGIKLWKFDLAHRSGTHIKLTTYYFVHLVVTLTVGEGVS